VSDNVRSITEWGEFYGSGFNLDDERGGRVTGLASTFGSYAITLLDNYDAFGEWGIGCPGTHGTSQHTATGCAMTGTSITYRTNHLWPWTIAVLCYGQTPVNIPLASLGAPGCTGYMLPFATTTHYANASGVATANLNVPNNPSLQDAALLTQFIALDPPLNSLGMQVSNGLVTSLRHW
jgi:hypothetical protein